MDYSASIVGGISNSCSGEVKQTVIALLRPLGFSFSFLTSSSSVCADSGEGERYSEGKPNSIPG